MNKKNWRRKLRRYTKPFRDWVGYFVFRTFQRLLVLVPIKWGIHLGSLLGRIAYLVVFWERRQALQNLRLAFPEKTEIERQRIAKSVFVNAGYSAIEVLYLPYLNAEYLSSHITLEGKNYFADFQQQGISAIALSAHFGNWELMAAYFSQVAHIKFAVVVRQLSNRYLDRFLMTSRQRWGVTAIQRGKSAATFLRLLRNKQTLGILADQDTKGEGIFVNFFGYPAYTQIGPAWLVLKYQLPLVPLFIVRHKENPLQHTIYIESPLAFELTSDFNTNIRIISELFTGKIEEYVRKFPEQWMWFHRRWKTKPKSESQELK